MLNRREGLSVAQMTQLKLSSAGAKSEYIVTKKTLVEMATKDISKDIAVDVYGKVLSD